MTKADVLNMISEGWVLHAKEGESEGVLYPNRSFFWKQRVEFSLTNKEISELLYPNRKSYTVHALDFGTTHEVVITDCITMDDRIELTNELWSGMLADTENFIIEKQ